MIVILEGIDNCGKNTIAHLLLKSHPNFTQIDFPDYNTSFGAFIRNELSRGTLPAISLQLLFSSERLSKAEEIATLAKDNVVICTRYSYSAIAYGVARGINKELLLLLEQELPKADVKIYLNVSPEESIKRSIEKDIFERDKGLLVRVEHEYKQIIAREADWYVVDATEPIERVLMVVEDIITNFNKNESKTS